MAINRRLPTVDSSRFSMVPRADVPRSTFQTEHSLKTTFNAGYLVPIEVNEVLPGDTHQGNVTIFARLATPLFPIMDALHLETFFFFVPARLLWSNFKKMMGERTNPSDSISYTIPTIVVDAGISTVCSVWDYFGIPTAGQLTSTIEINALPLRAYNLIWNEWFRDQNLQASQSVPLTDGPDSWTLYALYRRNKRHDYFTSALPWPLKGGVEVALPLTGQAPIMGLAVDPANSAIAGNPTNYIETGGGIATGWTAYNPAHEASYLAVRTDASGLGAEPLIYADMSTIAGATINALRLAFQTQRLLERDARSGTRYTELLRAHFGVTPEDTRLQRPEYIGGGRSAVETQAIPQTSEGTATSPLGALGATSMVSDQHRFSYSATEHGYIIGLVHVGAQLTYQQGLHKLWSRRTRYDFYWPVFAHLGEQAILNQELYCTGVDATDSAVFGYQERWAEYRHRPSRITGLYRSTSAGNIDEWHLAQQFTAQPVLNASFIQDDPPLSRVFAAGALANNLQVQLDSFWRIRTTRAMPMFSVPGMIDRL